MTEYTKEWSQGVRTMRDHVRAILEEEPELRELDDFDFYWAYVFRVTGWGHGDVWDAEAQRQIKKHANWDTVNRALEAVREQELKGAKEFLAAIARYDEGSRGRRDGMDLLRLYLEKCKYLPTDPETLCKKIQKNRAIMEAVVHA